VVDGEKPGVDSRDERSPYTTSLLKDDQNEMWDISMPVHPVLALRAGILSSFPFSDFFCHKRVSYSLPFSTFPSTRFTHMITLFLSNKCVFLIVFP